MENMNNDVAPDSSGTRTGKFAADVLSIDLITIKVLSSLRGYYRYKAVYSFMALGLLSKQDAHDLFLQPAEIQYGPGGLKTLMQTCSAVLKLIRFEYGWLFCERSEDVLRHSVLDPRRAWATLMHVVQIGLDPSIVNAMICSYEIDVTVSIPYRLARRLTRTGSPNSAFGSERAAFMLRYNTDPMIELLVLVSCSGIAFVVACLVALLFIRSKKSSDDTSSASGDEKTTTTVTTVASVTKINDGETHKLRRNDEYLAFDFDSKRAKGKMCNATTASSADGAATLKFTRDGDHWVIATDCDGDGNYTSYLTRGTDLIEAKYKDDLKKQRWSVDCTDAGCAFKSAKDGKYLAGSFKKPSFTTNPVRFVLA